MGLTLAEKILATHSGKKEVSPGDIVEADIDVAMVHELLGTSGGVAELFEETGVRKVWSKDKIVALLDHWVPAPNVDVAEIHKKCRYFVKKHGLKNWFDMKAGICHQVLVEKGFVRPGEIIVGTDSHMTTHGALGAFGTGIGSTDMVVVFAKGKLWFRVPETIKIVLQGKIPKYVLGKDIILKVLRRLGPDGANYKAVEFHGEALADLSIDGRMTISNMCVEAGAKVALIPPDQKTIEFVKKRSKKEIRPVYPDSNADYVDEMMVNVSEIEPQVSRPPNPTDSVPVQEVEGIELDQVFIGSCTNGRLEDLEVTAKILKGKKVNRGVRLIVIPASYEVYLNALRKGYLETILKAEGIVEAPTCGPCIGGHLGVLASGETALVTSSRNFTGRLGSPEAKVYLSSPATAAASAVEGKITDPRKYLR